MNTADKVWALAKSIVPTDVNIDRCYCFQVTFADLQTTAARTGAHSVEELQEHVEFGQQCRLCHPYVRRMLRTGRTSFDHIITAADDE